MTHSQNPGNSSIKVANAERVYSLDALRAVMMLLGLVIHAAITYTKIDYGSAWTLKDPNNNRIFDVIIGFIHAFRMPVFFVASGYFGALLFYKKGPKAMLVNRIKRILLPFLVGVLTIYPLIIFSFVYSGAAFAGSASPAAAAWQLLLSGEWLQFSLAHLWFLYFLAMFSVLGWLIAMVFKKSSSFTIAFNQFFTKLFKHFWLRIIAMMALYFACLYWMGSSGIKTNNKWAVDPATFAIYFLFFGAGWMVFTTKTLPHLSKYPIWQLGMATVLFLIGNLSPWPEASWVLMAKQLFTAVYGTLFIYGFIALFNTRFSHYSRWLNYQMEAAYWVYLIHLPIVAFIPGLMAGVDLPPVVKFLITFSGTAIICMLSYKYLVRGSFIGMFLNGKVYKSKRPQDRIHDESQATLVSS